MTKLIIFGLTDVPGQQTDSVCHLVTVICYSFIRTIGSLATPMPNENEELSM